MSAQTEQRAEELRDRIRESVSNRGRRASKKAWEAPQASDFAHGTVLSFDQTLTKTGFSVVRHDDTGLWVTEGNLLITQISHDHKGFEETYAKARTMEQAIDCVTLLLGSAVDTIVHEMPAVQGYRTESSLMAGYFVRRAAMYHARGVPVHMISNQAMRAVLNAPDERYDKKFVKQAVETLIPRENRRAKRWNQDVHDSVGLALTHLHQKKAR